MSDLLESAVAAHGGLDRWNHVKSITVDASITGALWHVKRKGDALKDVRFEVDTTRQLLTMDFVGQDKRSVFEPLRVVIQRRDGVLIDARDDPERSFDGHQLETPWDNIHLAYFSGEALWTYLNTPFVYAWPGFVTEEITPIEVDGETWRRLKVTFPDHIKSHTRQQISCFGPDGLLRRSDFTIDVIGGATGWSTPPTTATSTASSSRPRDEATPGRATTSSSRSRCWSPSTWARSPSADLARSAPIHARSRPPRLLRRRAACRSMSRAAAAPLHMWDFDFPM